jgi:chorismate-pyruvate lyase
MRCKNNFDDGIDLSQHEKDWLVIYGSLQRVFDVATDDQVDLQWLRTTAIGEFKSCRFTTAYKRIIDKIQ